VRVRGGAQCLGLEFKFELHHSHASVHSFPSWSQPVPGLGKGDKDRPSWEEGRPSDGLAGYVYAVTLGPQSTDMACGNPQALDDPPSYSLPGQ
jgi:hypothetical protein